jgi:hypothetical protein
LQAGITAKVDAPLAAAATSFTDFSGIAGELTNRQQTGANLLH